MQAEDWIEVLLAGKGRLSISALLAKRIELAQLRELATAHGLKPKGFRVEKAKAKQLADLLAERFALHERLREAIGEALAAADASEADARAGDAADEAADEDKAAIATVERELEQLGHELATLRSAHARAEASADKARKSRDAAIEEREQAERAAEEATRRASAGERELRAARREIEELAGSGASADAAARRAELAEASAREASERDRTQRLKLAELTSRVRELESEVEELESWLPRGSNERRKRLARSLAQGERAAGVTPIFREEFFRTLDELEHDARRRIWIAIARLVLHGWEYPGLQAKALKGMGGLYSIRGADHLRVYLLHQGDEAVILAAGKREEQDTFLKRWREA